MRCFGVDFVVEDVHGLSPVGQLRCLLLSADSCIFNFKQFTPGATAVGAVRDYLSRPD